MFDIPDFPDLNRYVRNRYVMGGILIMLLMVTLVYPLATFQPGFEGAKCNFFGITFENSLHRYQDAEDPIMVGSDYFDMGGKTTLRWTSFATPNDAGLGCHCEFQNWPFYDTRDIADLHIHVENNVQLQHITRQGDPDPLAWNVADPLEGRIIEYWSKKGEKATETEDSFLYEYEMTKEKFMITPAEFWVGFYMIPSKDGAGTSSGWREGAWSDLTAWFRLDFNVWDNAYYDDWFESPEAEDVFTSEYGGTVTSKERLEDPSNYRGGWPIAGWIQGWEKAGWTSAGGDNQSPVWWTVRGSETAEYTQEQLWDLKDILMSRCEFSPGMVGTFISLYDSPDVKFTYDSSDPLSSEPVTESPSMPTPYVPGTPVWLGVVSPDNINWDDNDAVANSVKAPDSRMKKVMYFPININNFDTYAKDMGWWGLSGWKIYYPSAYFRVRMIYGVYGSFKYLWTEEVAKPFIEVDPETGEPEYTGGLEYPDEFETHGTTVINQPGVIDPFEDLLAGLGNWFSNPFNMLFFMFMLIIIALVVFTILNPGVWGSLALAYKGTRKKKR